MHVRKIGLIALTCLYMLGFTEVNSAFAFGPIAKFEITHTHEHDKDHEHSPESHPSDLDKKPVNDHDKTPHSHQLLIGGQVLYLRSEFAPNFGNSFEKDLRYRVFNQRPPQSPAHFSIFRPPIL